jgi:hypothetical protein
MTQETDGAPITLIRYSGSTQKLESFVAGWRERAELMSKRPGFRSLQHRALRPDARSVLNCRHRVAVVFFKALLPEDLRPGRAADRSGNMITAPACGSRW